VLPSSELFNHTARLWTPTETVGRYLGVELEYLPGVTFNCRVANPGRAQGNQSGTGVSESGTWKVYALAEGLTVAERMVIQVLTGNEAPRNLYVDRAYEPRSMFGFIRPLWQIVCRQWDGVLNEES
jgi:hypothetical protein